MQYSSEEEKIKMSLSSSAFKCALTVAPLKIHQVHFEQSDSLQIYSQHFSCGQK